MNDSLDFSDNTRDEFSPAQDAFIAEVADVAVEAAPETDAVADAAPVVTEPNGFELLGLAPELVQACVDLGYLQPTAVQNNVIPKAMLAEGEQRFADLMVSSQTGSGKTAAFLLPVLHTLLKQQAAAEAAERAERERLAAEAAAERAAGVRSQDELPWNRRDHALFVAFAPFDAPRFAVTVVVEHGGGGSTAAAPIARDIMLFAQHGGLPPEDAYPTSQRARIREDLALLSERILPPDGITATVSRT